jgi:hypothetical protein
LSIAASARLRLRTTAVALWIQLLTVCASSVHPASVITRSWSLVVKSGRWLPSCTWRSRISSRARVNSSAWRERHQASAPRDNFLNDLGACTRRAAGSQTSCLWKEIKVERLGNGSVRDRCSHSQLRCFAARELQGTDCLEVAVVSSNRAVNSLSWRGCIALRTGQYCAAASPTNCVAYSC